MDCLSLPTPPDHPRIRGEHLGELVVRTAKPRIIPAYAGSTYGTLGECH